MQEDNEITEAALAEEARRAGEEDEKGENKGALQSVPLLVCAVRRICFAKSLPSFKAMTSIRCAALSRHRTSSTRSSWRLCV